jgi:DNA-binding MarR family transcriptional regulator
MKEQRMSAPDSHENENGMDLGVLRDLVSYRLRLVQIAAFKDFEEATKSFGQAPRYFGLLSLIETNPGLPQARFAEAIHLVRSSLVPILDKLEAEDLVVRRSSPSDRRQKSVWLTPKGKKTLARLRPLVLAHEARLTNSFSSRDKAELLEFLEIVDGNLRKKTPAADVA